MVQVYMEIDFIRLSLEYFLTKKKFEKLKKKMRLPLMKSFVLSMTYLQQQKKIISFKFHLKLQSI